MAKSFFLLTLLLVLFISIIASAQQEEITLSTYYPAPFGEYDELCAEKLLVDLPSAAELQDMARGDCHITRSLIVGSGIGSDFSYDRLNTLGTPLYDGDVIIKGYVGIGTTGPTGKLHIFGGDSSGATPQLIIGGGVAGSAISDLYVLDSKNANTGVGYAAKVIGVNIQNQVDASNQVLQRTTWGGVTGAAALYLGTDDVYQGGFGILTSPQGSTAGTVLTERFTVKGNGNVGIGTTGPNVKLDVRGAASSRVQMTLSDGNTASAMIRAGNSTAAVFGSDVGINFRTGASWTDADSGGTTVMSLTTTGNVGIGTTSPDPGAKLEVAGRVKITGGGPGNGKVLASDSAGLATWRDMTPRWSVRVCSANNYTLPSQFTSPIATFSLPSFGTIFVDYDNGNRWGYNNSVLFRMTVNSNGSQTKTLRLFGVDNWVYVYLRGTLIYSYVGAATFDDAPRSVTFNLTDGDNLVEIIFADQGGAWYLSLIGDLIDNSNVYFVGL